MPSLLLAALAAVLAAAGEDERRLSALAAGVAQREALLRDRVATLYRLSRGGLPRALVAGDRDLRAARLSLLLRVVRRDLFEIRQLRLERNTVQGRVVRGSRPPPPDPSASALEPLRGRLAAPLRGSAAQPALGGLTFPARNDRQVRAVAPGRVLFAAPFEGFGRLVLVDHGGGDTSLYARLSDLLVSEGDAVDAGRPLGRVAAAGSLYFELRRGADLLPAARWLGR